MTGYLVLVARCLLAAVLLLSTTTKVSGRASFQAFRDWVRDLTVVPPRWVTRVAVLMTAVEAITLLMLALPATYPAGLILAALVMASFAGSAAVLVRRGITVPCRCFGAASAGRPMGATEIVRNILLTAIATSAAAAAVLAAPPIPAGAAIILAILLGGALGLVGTRLDDLRGQGAG